MICHLPHQRYSSCRQHLHFVCVSIYILLNWNTSVILVQKVHGWGQKGHEIVGNVASALLSEHALHQIEVLLNISSTNHTVQAFNDISTSSRMTKMMMTTNGSGSNNSDTVQNFDCVEYCTPLAIVADWADRVRFYKKWSASLHYIDIRDDLILPNGCPVGAGRKTEVSHYSNSTTQCYFNYTRDCPGDRCVAGAIMNYTKQLRQDVSEYLIVDDTTGNTTDNAYNVKESLMFLVHFMGDIHQPLHCSRTTDRGGNNIHVHYDTTKQTITSSTSNTTSKHTQGQQLTSLRSRGTDRFYYDHRDYRSHNRRRTAVSSSSPSHHSLNLHAVWDDSIIETILEQDFDDSRNAFEVSLLAYIHNIRTNHPIIYKNQWLHCKDATNIQCVSEWGEESFMYAMQYAYSNVDGTEIVDGTTLDEQYYTTRNPIVRQQLAIASVRLATNLEQIFSLA